MSAKQRPLETTYIVDPSDEEEDDEDWEDVELSAVASSPIPGPSPAVSSRHAGDLQITFDDTEKSPLSGTTTRRARAGRRTLSAAEKRLRWDAHKAHILCLLVHVTRRNAWCNDSVVQKHVWRIFPPNVIKYLTPPKRLPTFSRSTTFVDGLKQAIQIFHSSFKVTEAGLTRPFWSDNPQEFRDPVKISQCDAAKTEIILSLDGFRQQANHLRGSRDTGAQYFCAFLRGIGVAARVVCSLQVLPFEASNKISAVPGSTIPGTPGRSAPATPASPPKEPGGIIDITPTTASITQPLPTKRRRLCQPSFPKRRPAPPCPSVAREAPMPELPKTPVKKQPPTIPSESPCPIFWVEAYNEAVGRWLAVDPVVTASISQVSKLEPSPSDRFNCMRYVVAFESDASARDVTARYTSTFTSKVLKRRVDRTPSGQLWWQGVMEHYSKPLPDERDDVEDEELAAKLANEPMPRSIQDFKGHPKYVLERHLRRNEIIHPKVAVGNLPLPSSARGGERNREPVYRREDVQLVRSAEGWYRLGRQLNIGEQPSKRIRATGFNRAMPMAMASGGSQQLDGSGGVTEVSLYSEKQTHLYNPPPINNNNGDRDRGRVPKNDYGNIDVFVPSMVPEGGFHLAHPEAAHAARILGVDYADAVTGFQFKGRHGTAVVEGIVASTEYRDALLTVVQALDDARVQAARDERAMLVLRTWKMLLLKLRIREQVLSYAVEGEDEEQVEARVRDQENGVDDDHGGGDDDDDDDDDGFAGAGGFMPDPDS